MQLVNPRMLNPQLTDPFKTTVLPKPRSSLQSPDLTLKRRQNLTNPKNKPQLENTNNTSQGLQSTLPNNQHKWHNQTTALLQPSTIKKLKKLKIKN